MSHFIHTGFAHAVADLNNTPVNERMLMLPGVGRAYARDNWAGFYAASIHTNVVSEETHSHRILLEAMSKAGGHDRNSVYMGCAGFLNFSYIAAMRPAAAILFDINPLQTLFWQKTIKGLETSPSYASFVQYMKDTGPALQVAALLACGNRAIELDQSAISIRRDAQPMIKGLFREVAAPQEDKWWNGDTVELRWRGSDYAYLHMMAKSGALGALTIDMTDEAAWTQLSDRLDIVGRHVGVLYASNALNFLAKGHCWSHGDTEYFAADDAQDNFKRAARGKTQHVITERASPSLLQAVRVPQMA